MKLTFHRKQQSVPVVYRDNKTVGISRMWVRSSLESLAFPEDRILKTSNGFEVNYYITDHLGSIRTIVKPNAENNGVDIVEQNDYYPFGEKHKNANLAASATNRFLYNGKEKQTSGNIGFLDYGARMYDTRIARWMTQDSLAEKQYSFSAYNYCIGNPVKLMDPDGKKIVIGNPLNRLLAFFGVNNFEKKVKQQLQTLKSLSVELNQVITELEESEHTIYIKHSQFRPEIQENGFAPIRKKVRKKIIFQQEELYIMTRMTLNGAMKHTDRLSSD